MLLFSSLTEYVSLNTKLFDGAVVVVVVVVVVIWNVADHFNQRFLREQVEHITQPGRLRVSRPGKRGSVASV